MARPFVPDELKRRTVPIRLSKPSYRELNFIAGVKDVAIQDLLRDALDAHLESLRLEIESGGITMPSGIALAQMSDADFYALVQRKHGRPPELGNGPNPPKRGFSRKPAASAA